MKESLATIMLKARKDRGLSLREAEELSGVSNAYISLLETGKRTEPHPHILKALAKVYGLSIVKVMEIAGYLEESPISRESEKDEVERLFREAVANPDFGFGRRSKSELDYPTKKAIVMMYKKLKGQKE